MKQLYITLLAATCLVVPQLHANTSTCDQTALEFCYKSLKPIINQTSNMFGAALGLRGEPRAKGIYCSNKIRYDASARCQERFHQRYGTRCDHKINLSLDRTHEQMLDAQAAYKKLTGKAPGSCRY